MCTRGLFRTNAEAEKVAMIIAGDIPTITLVSAQLDNWFELVPPYLLFIRPCATLPQLKDAVKVYGIQTYFIKFQKKITFVSTSFFFSLRILFD